MAGEDEKWREDEGVFRGHFGISYDDFGDLILALPDNKKARYEELRGKDEEAAISWAIAEGRRLDLFSSGENS